MKPVWDLAGSHILVTGGNGFLGRSIVEKLLARGATVRSLARSDTPELRTLGVETHRGSLEDADVVRQAVSGVDAVIHTAAKAGVWGDPEEFRRINLLGTENIVAACAAEKVRRLVYCSTPSVVFGGESLEGVDEAVPYPTDFESAYPETKAAAEQHVRGAADADLATVSLRPHLIWGPRDPHFIPRIVGRARAGRLRMVGDGTNLVDTIYVDNAADAHLLAAERLEPGCEISGKVYFLSQGDPVPVGTMINHLLEAAGESPWTRSVPPGLAYAGGALLEAVYRGLGIQTEPMVTRFLARELSTAHWFDISAARRDLEYEPAVSIEEGLDELRGWLRENPVP